MQKVRIHALAHITGGGILENLPRVLPTGYKAVVDLGSWSRGEVFNWLQTQGNISETEMLRTLNCGIGMITIIPAHAVKQALEVLAQHGETAYHIGTIEQTPHKNTAPFVVFENGSE